MVDAGNRCSVRAARSAAGSGIRVAHYSADATPRRKQLIQTGESKGFTTQMKKSTVLPPAAVIAAGIVMAAPAHADQWDYVSYLDSKGVFYSTTWGVIGLGKQVCHELLGRNRTQRRRQLPRRAHGLHRR
jgi:hypothetical protein